jgi:hypothetical protein
MKTYRFNVELVNGNTDYYVVIADNLEEAKGDVMKFYQNMAQITSWEIVE